MFGMRHCEPSHWAGGRRWRRHFGGGIRRTARHGRRRHDARRPHAGDRRSAADRARADRRAAAPRLRDHQGAGGQDRGLVLAEPRHRLSDADLSGGGRLRDGADRRRQEALHDHRGRPRASRREPRLRRRGAGAHERGRREGHQHARGRFGAATTRDEHPRDRRRWCAPRSTTCATVAAKRIEDDADAETKIVEVLARAAQEIRKS